MYTDSDVSQARGLYLSDHDPLALAMSSTKDVWWEHTMRLDYIRDAVSALSLEVQKSIHALNRAEGSSKTGKGEKNPIPSPVNEWGK